MFLPVLADEPSSAEIRAAVAASDAEIARRQSALTDAVSLERYRDLVVSVGGTNVWTRALQRAVDEHEVVTIPASDETYWLDGSVTLPSNRRLEAAGATVSLLPGTRVLMLRNRHTVDGTLRPVPAGCGDTNIAVVGGTWCDWADRRAGYGKSGRYDLTERRKGNFYGVSTLFLFSNCSFVSLRDVTFRNCSGFAVQCGDGEAYDFAHVRFDGCFADGLHLNGNLARVHARDIRGKVGDDLVALNAYDWLNSSVNFGPQRDIVCEDLELVLEDGKGYPAIRIQPAGFRYADGTTVDCAVSNVVFRKVRGITTFKMYLQTPVYAIGSTPEWSALGSGGNIHFEDVAIDLAEPIDGFRTYRESDPVRGHFGAFEIGANLSSIHFTDLDVRFHADRYPLSHLVTVGPKSYLGLKPDGTPDFEIFDPYVSCRVDAIVFENLRTHGAVPAELVHTTVFDNVNGDGNSSGKGSVGTIRGLGASHL